MKMFNVIVVTATETFYLKKENSEIMRASNDDERGSFTRVDAHLMIKWAENNTETLLQVTFKVI